jgi:nucleolar protein 12
VQPPPKTVYQSRIQKENENDAELSELEDADTDNDSDDDSDDDAEDVASADSDASDDDNSDAVESSSEDEAVLANVKESMLNGAQEKPAKKRKRGDKEEVEDTYMRKLAREELKEEEQRQKKRKTEKARAMADSDDEDEDDEEASDEPRVVQSDFTVPKHETLAEGNDKDAQEVEKAGRTVFLGNVSTECLTSKSAEKSLKKHLESFIADLADNNPPHKVESIRFRSTAFDNSLPKRAAFAKKEIMDSTTRSTNAYAVYTTKIAAREAVKKLNGSMLLKRHLHVDSLAHPTKIDHRRCVFVGNLPFVDDRSQVPTPEGEVKKKKPSSDVEEGLWTHFAKAGKIESVRVVRDAATRVGKGFAYVQFVDENGVEAALHFNEQNYPPMLPRKLRVTRCRAEKKNKKDKPRMQMPTTERGSNNGKAGYVQKLSAEQKSIQGRARSMLGKVAKAQTKEGFVFEGHRAKEGQGKAGLKFKGSGGKKKGPNGRKSRSTAWKSKTKESGKKAREG